MDGLWIDMNEPAVYNNTFYNLTKKQDGSSLWFSGTALSCPLSNDDNDTVYDTPPYWTHNVYYNTPGQAALSKYVSSENFMAPNFMKFGYPSSRYFHPISRRGSKESNLGAVSIFIICEKLQEKTVYKK